MIYGRSKHQHPPEVGFWKPTIFYRTCYGSVRAKQVVRWVWPAA